MKWLDILYTIEVILELYQLELRKITTLNLRSYQLTSYLSIVYLQSLKFSKSPNLFINVYTINCLVQAICRPFEQILERPPVPNTSQHNTTQHNTTQQGWSMKPMLEGSGWSTSSFYPRRVPVHSMVRNISEHGEECSLAKTEEANQLFGRTQKMKSWLLSRTNSGKDYICVPIQLFFLDTFNISDTLGCVGERPADGCQGEGEGWQEGCWPWTRAGQQLRFWW